MLAPAVKRIFESRNASADAGEAPPPELSPAFAEEVEKRLAERTEPLRASLREKEALLRELGQSVKTSLEVIASLIDLQAGEAEDEKGRRMFRRVRRRVDAVALLHENLVRFPGRASIDLGEYLDKLTRNIASVYSPEPDRFSILIEAENVLLGSEAAVPCGLILNELIANSMEHAFPQPSGTADPEIAVSARRRAGGRCTLRVADNGIGLPPDLNWRQPSTLGLQLVNILVDELGGSIRLNPRKGTEFVVSFVEKRPPQRVGS
jgi:two-component sensor histidine kinase